MLHMALESLQDSLHSVVSSGLSSVFRELSEHGVTATTVANGNERVIMFRATSLDSVRLIADYFKPHSMRIGGNPANTQIGDFKAYEFQTLGFNDDLTTSLIGMDYNLEEQMAFPDSDIVGPVYIVTHKL